MTKPLEAVTVVIPVRDAADSLGKILPGWRVVMEKTGRAFEVVVVDDGSADAAAVERAVPRDPHFRLLRHDTRKGYGACLRTALGEAQHPLFFYAAVDYPYTPKDITKLLDRINLKDEVLGRQPDLISGCRTGIPKPALPHWVGRTWALFARVFAGMPIPEPSPWHGWAAFRYRTRAKWVYGVPLADVNSCFKLFRTDFLRRFPIQSDGDFVHTELVAKATFLTSIMDEVPLTPKADAIPPMGDIRADRRKLSPGGALFAHKKEPAPPVAVLVPGAPALPVADLPGPPPPSPAPSP